jgi:lysophospholipase L1-like esterase
MKTANALKSAAISTIASLALLETVPRLIDIPGLTERDLRPLAFHLSRANIQAHPYLAYTNKPNYSTGENAKHKISHNSLGFRGPEISPLKPDDTYRVVCLGGSSTYGHGPSSNETTWPARLEEHLRKERPHLNIEVINAGCRGYSSFESLSNYAFRVSDLRPDHVVIYHTINDLRCALYPNVQPDNTHWRPVWRNQTPHPFESSYAYLVWRKYMTDHFATIGDMGNYLIVDFEKNLKYPGDSPAYQRRGVQTQTGYNSFKRNLEAITAMAINDGAEVTIMTQAYKPQSDPNTNEELLAFAEMTELLKELTEESDAKLVDIQEIFRRQPQDSAASPLFIESTDVAEVHLLDAGADLLAKSLASALLSE